MNGPEHYLEAERLLATTDETVHSAEMIAARAALAQAHGQLAEVAGFVEQVGLAIEPIPANSHGPAEPGNEWGRAVFGDPS